MLLQRLLHLFGHRWRHVGRVATNHYYQCVVCPARTYTRESGRLVSPLEEAWLDGLKDSLYDIRPVRSRRD